MSSMRRFCDKSFSVAYIVGVSAGSAVEIFMEDGDGIQRAIRCGSVRRKYPDIRPVPWGVTLPVNTLRRRVREVRRGPAVGHTGRRGIPRDTRSGRRTPQMRSRSVALRFSEASTGQSMTVSLPEPRASQGPAPARPRT